MSEAHKRTPRPVPERRDTKSYPLTPIDGFVLSRIDGLLNESDLAASTGVPEAQVQASLTKLEGLGLIAFGGPAVPPPPRTRSGTMSSPHIGAASPGAPPAPSAPGGYSNTVPRVPAAAGTRPALESGGAMPAAAPASGGAMLAATAARSVPPSGGSVPSMPTAPAPRTPAPRTPAPPSPQQPPQQAPPPTDKTSLDEDIDLEPELRQRILDAHRDLDRRDYYNMLGIPEGADRKAVKRAYYELAAAFHPDRYFRKRLGTFKVRMEAVFTRLTLAHDTLSDREKRGEYDAYLSEQRIAQAIEDHLAHGLTQAKQIVESVERAVRASEPPPPRPGGLPGPPPGPLPGSPPGPRAPPTSTPPTSVPSMPSMAVSPSIVPDVDVAARRNVLARRLLGSSSGRPPSSPTVANVSRPAPPSMSTTDAMSALKRRYDDRMHGAKSSEARKFAAQGDTAFAAGDLVAAANAFRIAANLVKDDAELERKAREAREKADVLLRETYMRQGRYEEGNNQWVEASRSWSRVCKASQNDANAHDRAAHALAKAGGDMHDAVKFALRACELDPKNAYYRVTLASCYSAAGLTLNARRELDTAAQLAPHDGTIQSMIKRAAEPA